MGKRFALVALIAVSGCTPPQGAPGQFASVGSELTSGSFQGHDIESDRSSPRLGMNGLGKRKDVRDRLTIHRREVHPRPEFARPTRDPACPPDGRSGRLNKQ